MSNVVSACKKKKIIERNSSWNNMMIHNKKTFKGNLNDKSDISNNNNNRRNSVEHNKINLNTSVNSFLDNTPYHIKKTKTYEEPIFSIASVITYKSNNGVPLLAIEKKRTQKNNATVNVIANNNSNSFHWENAVIYQVLTDRFFDGNESNNTASGNETYGEGPGYYHGGDFAGLTQKLDYLKDLGVNTIWITPIVEQIPGVSNSDVTWVSPYHGYWANDFTKLNPTFGTEEEFKALIQKAHSMDMKIMVDVILNHAGYGTEKNEQFKDMFRTEEVNGDDILSKQSGMPDFLTEIPEVSAKLVEWQSAWVKNYGID